MFENSYTKHQQKIWKKNKCKRLVRKIAKMTAKRHSNAGAGLVLMSGGKDEEEEEAERERLTEECENRAAKNKLWRESRERERLGIPEKSKKKVDKNRRNEKLGSEMICKNCSDDLLTEIWQCRNGHPVCENCVDKESLEEMANQSFSGKFSTTNYSVAARSDELSRRSVFDIKSEATLSEKLSCLEVGSYVRPELDSIDFFDNTLKIRKDAIQAYSDYNAYLIEDKDRPESMIIGDKLDNDDNETVFYNKFLKEECPPPYAASVGGDCLKPVTLVEMMDEEERKAKEVVQSNWKLAFEGKKRELDFFANTLEIRKDAIETYKDYSKLIEENIQKEVSEDTEEDDSDSDTEYEDDTDTETSVGSCIVDCPVCSEPIVERNLQAEKISKLFFSMMEIRNKME